MTKKNTSLIINILFLALVLAVLVFIPGCSGDDHDHAEPPNEKAHHEGEEGEGHDHDHGEEAEEKDLVHLTEAEMKEFGVESSTAGPAAIEEHINLSGEIIAAPNRIAHLRPRFSGIVQDVRKLTGDRVKKGDVIAIIESNESLVKYKLTSAISGTVIDMHMTPGENVTDDSKTVVVADLSLVWATFKVYQQDLFTIKTGQEAIIRTGGKGGGITGTISYISPVVDEHTRTAAARVVLDNRNGQWKPGMFITAVVATGQTEVPLAVTAGAVMLYNGQRVIFVKEGDGYHPHPVQTGLQNSRWVQILSGLKEGQVYISKGAFLLKAELQKGSFGHGHAH
jgi:cobalt-zinc-cadmium efflux system membrane fusion protein